MREDDDLKKQLTIARSEINNLRQQVRNLQHVQRKDIESISRLLKDFRCEGCTSTQQQQQLPQQQQEFGNNGFKDDNAHFRPIGIIRTAFPEKRGVPRQSTVGSRLRSVLQLADGGAFTNPEHSLEGLAEFSHMWLIYHFHRNNAHPKAKVAPPRLGGERVGVFSTRSPHRPCPIGLSLVEIEKIDGAKISFYGTDMVDGTPVLDIKPYIPYYDTPALSIDSGRTSTGPTDGNTDFYDSRQEPDGEESELELFVGATGYTNSARANASASNMNNDNNMDSDVMATSPTSLPPPPPLPSAVRVPNWVVATHRLNVCFNEHAEAQLIELQVQKQCIVDILEADPRSIYLRTKYGSQIFTFQLSEVTVTCKFDDKAATVTVVQIRRNENIQMATVEPMSG